MATSLTSKLALTLTGTYTDDLDLQDVACNLRHSINDDLANGTAADQADLIFHDQRTLTATSEELDLAGGLTDAFGNTLTFVKIKALLIHNKSTTATEDLLVGGAAANAFIDWVASATDIVTVQPNAVFLLWSPNDGYTVTAATGDLLKIDSGADTITYDIIIIGTSA
jgi:hypothetical protein